MVRLIAWNENLRTLSGGQTVQVSHLCCADADNVRRTILERMAQLGITAKNPGIWEGFLLHAKQSSWRCRPFPDPVAATKGYLVRDGNQ